MRRRHGALTYALAWIAGGAVIALSLIALIRTVGGAEETVEVTPIHQSDLGLAATRARCRLLGDGDGRPLEPASHGWGTRRTRPGIYEEPLDREAIIGALRAGLVVIQYRPEVPEEVVGELHALQEAVPAGTVVTVNPRMTVDAAATAWRRALLCPRVREGTLDAIGLFRGRYLGARPPAP